MSAEESLGRAEELLQRLEGVRGKLEQTEDPEAAIDILAELSELAREIQAEITRAKSEADVEADEDG